MRLRPPSQRRGDRGAVAVEFALIAPIFLMLVFGIVAFGIIFAQKLALGNSARQAARYAVVQERDCGQIFTEARSAATGTIAMDTTKIDITVTRKPPTGSAQTLCSKTTPAAATKPCENAAEGSAILVTTTYASQIVVPLAVVDNSVTVTGEGIFRCEFS